MNQSPDILDLHRKEEPKFTRKSARWFLATLSLFILPYTLQIISISAFAYDDKVLYNLFFGVGFASALISGILSMRNGFRAYQLQEKSLLKAYAMAGSMTLCLIILGQAFWMFLPQLM